MILKRCPICKREGKRYSGKSLPHCTHKEALYAVKLRINGRQVLKTVGPRKEDAKNYEAELINKIRTGDLGDEIRPIMMKDFAKEWYDGYVVPNCAVNTRWDYGNSLKNYVIPILGNKLLIQLKAPDIIKLRDFAQSRLSAKSVNNVLTMVKGMLNYAIKLGYLRRNEALHVDLLPRPHREMAYLNMDEFVQFLSHLEQPYRTFFFTKALTGIREGELMGLKTTDIDWETGTILIQRKVRLRNKKKENLGPNDPSWCFEDTKFNEKRIIPLTRSLMTALKHHIESEPPNAHNLIFSSANGSPLRPQNFSRRAFHPALKAAGITKGITPHSLRHSYATWLARQREDLGYISKVLGHSSVDITAKIYHHILPSQYRDVRDRLEAQTQICDTTVIPLRRPTAANCHQLELTETKILRGK